MSLCRVTVWGHHALVSLSHIGRAVYYCMIVSLLLCGATVSCYGAMSLCHAVVSCCCVMSLCHAIIARRCVMSLCHAVVSGRCDILLCHATASCCFVMPLCHVVSHVTVQCCSVWQVHPACRQLCLSVCMSVCLSFCLSVCLSFFVCASKSVDQSLNHLCKESIIVWLAGNLVFHGPREEVVPFFESMHFYVPERKAVSDFLQEVTSMKDQKVSQQSAASACMLCTYRRMQCVA